MSGSHNAEELLRDIAGQEDSLIDLAAAALALAALEKPGSDLGAYRDHLARLCSDVHASLDAGATVIEALNLVILHSHGYAGDTLTYDDIQNANLMRVIDRRKGLPVALGILFLHTARAQGIVADGLSFPGHFLIRIDDACGRHIVDPFNEGQVRSAADLRDMLKATAGLEAELTPDHYEAVSNRDILIRLQNNIKARHERAGRSEEALRCIDRMLLFAPDMMSLWWEAGVIHARGGNLSSAIEAFKTIVERAADETVRHDAAKIIQRLRRRLN